MDPSHSPRPAAAGQSLKTQAAAGQVHQTQACAGFLEHGAAPGPDPDDEPPSAGVHVSDPLWYRHVGKVEAWAARAARVAGADADIVLTSDRAVQRLNAAHRGRNKPTNVLTYPAPAPGMRGEIVLALGTVLREAAAAHRRPAHHLAHLIVHGALHLAGHDHHHPGEARRMEREESRLLHRMRVPNPWRQA